MSNERSTCMTCRTAGQLLGTADKALDKATYAAWQQDERWGSSSVGHPVTGIRHQGWRDNMMLRQGACGGEYGSGQGVTGVKRE
jgi:hypothetical protein